MVRFPFTNHSNITARLPPGKPAPVSQTEVRFRLRKMMGEGGEGVLILRHVFNGVVTLQRFVDSHAQGLLRAQMSTNARQPAPESAQCKIHQHPRLEEPKKSESGKKEVQSQKRQNPKTTRDSAALAKEIIRPMCGF